MNPGPTMPQMGGVPQHRSSHGFSNYPSMEGKSNPSHFGNGANSYTVNSSNSSSKNFVAQFQQYSEMLDEFIGRVGTPIKPWLPSIGRFLIVATFFEDGFRLFSQWDAQVYYIWKIRGIPRFITVLYLFFNIVLMYLGSISVVAHKQLIYGVGALLFVIISQAFAYGLVFNFYFFFRNMSVIGGLLMVLSDAFVRDRRALALPGLPIIEDKDKSKYFQLAGRIMLIFLFISYMFTEGGSAFKILTSLFGLGACILIAIGYKTRLSAASLVLLLVWKNLASNRYWAYETDDPLRDFLRYEHFQVLSIIGGLLLVVNSGPGALSMDEKKKIY